MHEIVTRSEDRSGGRPSVRGGSASDALARGVARLSIAAGAEGSLLLFYTIQKPPRFICSEGLDASIEPFFTESWDTRNEAIRRGVEAVRYGRPVQTEWLLFTPEDYRLDSFHQEFLRPHGFAWFAGLFVTQSASATVTPIAAAARL